jgi:hypothetical protein
MTIAVRAIMLRTFGTTNFLLSFGCDNYRGDGPESTGEVLGISGRLAWPPGRMRLPDLSRPTSWSFDPSIRLSGTYGRRKLVYGIDWLRHAGMAIFIYCWSLA